MKTRRIAVIVAGLSIVSVGLAGCHSGGTTTATSTSTVLAKDTLVGSLGALAHTSYAIELTTQHLNAIGSVDPNGNVVTITAHGTRSGQPIRVQTLSIAQDSWAKIDIGTDGQKMGINPSKWLRLDPTKVAGAGSMPFDQSDVADAFDLRDVLSGIITVNRVDPQHYKGTIDLTGVHNVASLVPAGSRLGSAATNVPFTATTDRHGRLTDLEVGGVGPDYSFDLGISDYSAAAPVEPPNDVDVVTAPNAAYQLVRAAT